MTATKTRKTAHIADTVDSLTTVVNGKAPTAHTHPISDITNLQINLDAKSPTTHTHAIGDITSLQTSLDGKALMSHTHVIGDVTGLQTALDSKSAMGHTHAMSDITNLVSSLAGKSDTSHTHIIGDVTGLQTAIDGKAATSHTHVIGDVTGLQTAIDGKAATSHVHTIANVTGLQGEIDDIETKFNDFVPLTQKGAANGVATLDSAGIITASQLPSFVDDVMEYTNQAGFPSSGETGKIYVAIDTSKIYRWTGSQYIEISSQVSTADSANELATARTISITGDGSGSVSFDGSADVSLSLTVSDDSHSHAIATSSAAGFMSTTHATRVNNMRQNAGDGLTKDSSQRFAHGNTSSVANTSNTNANVLQSLTFDDYGHVATHASVDVTPALIGAATSSHNHDSSYAAINHNHDAAYAALNHNHTGVYAATSHNHDAAYASINHAHNLSDITVDSSLNMGSNSITGVTTLSTTSLVLGTGGTVVSSANWTQGGTAAFNDAVTINDDLKVNDGSLTVESDDRTTSNPTFNINALAQSGSDVDRGFSMAFDQSDARRFEIFLPDIDSDGGKQRVMWQDTTGDFYIQPKGAVDGMRFVSNGTFQFGWNGSTNGSALLGTGTSGEGFQIRDDGWTAIASGHGRVVDINRRSTNGEAIRFRDDGAYAGAFTYSSGVITLSTPSDKRTKENVEDITGALDAIKTLEPKTYNQFGDMDNRKAGLIAQEVEKTTFRNSVNTCDTEEFPDFKTLDYAYFIPYMIAALKEASEKIDRLEAQIKTLQT